MTYPLFPRLLRIGCVSAISAVFAACSTAPKHAAAPVAGPAVAPANNYLLRIPSNIPGASRPDFPPAAEMVDQESKAYPDLWARIRQGYSMPSLESALTDNRTQWYAQQPAYLERMVERSSQYLFHIVEELEKRQMPTELALLPFVESAFDPQAVSSAKAAGLWQFIPSTGKHFSLQQNMFRDDRRNVVASTDAALNYLQKLHNMFGDWHLALAAYNWGEGNVMRALKRAGVAGPGAYQQISMPRETQEYVPKLMALRNIVQAPGSYGLALPHIANHPYFREVALNQDIDVAKAAELAGISVRDLRQLNPGSNKPVIIAAGTPRILLPWERAEDFVRNVNKHFGPLSSWTAWQVPTTMTVAQAAARVGMSAAQLRALNHVPNSMKIRAGSTLLVARSALVDQDISIDTMNNATLSFAPNVVTTRIALRAQRNKETVAQLAKRYGQNAAAVARANGLSSASRLKAGQTLFVTVTRRVNDTLALNLPQQRSSATAAILAVPSLSNALRRQTSAAAHKTAQDHAAQRVALAGSKNRVVRARATAPTANDPVDKAVITARAAKVTASKGKARAATSRTTPAAKGPSAGLTKTAKVTKEIRKKHGKLERVAQSK